MIGTRYIFLDFACGDNNTLHYKKVTFKEIVTPKNKNSVNI